MAQIHPLTGDGAGPPGLPSIPTVLPTAPPKLSEKFPTMGTTTATVEDKSENLTMKEKGQRMNEEQMQKYTMQLEQNAKAILKDKTNFTRVLTIPKYLHEKPAEGWEDRWKMAHVMESRAVKSFIVILIIANAVCIGVQADYGGDANMWLGIEVIFLVFFCLELVLNCYSFGWLYFQVRV